MYVRNGIVSLLAAGALALLVPLPALAAEVQSGDTISVGPNQVITDDLYAFGSTVVIQGTVQGDVIAAGSMVTISGHVTGNVMAAGNSVTVTGPVDGSVRIAGSVLDLTGPVAGDALMAGSAMTLASTGHIGRDALLAGATMDLRAPVARNVNAAGDRLSVASTVGGGINARVTDLVLADGAAVAGPVTYTSNHDASVAPSATVGNGMQRTAPVTRTNPWEILGIDLLALVRGFIGMAALGLLLVFAFPRVAATTTATLRYRWPGSILAGFGIVVGTPVLAFVVFLLGLVIGGWWIGLMLLVLYAILAPIGYVACAEWLGSATLQIANRPAHALWAMLAGLLILGLLSIVPFVGAIVVMVAAMFGVGGLALAAWQAYRQQPPVSTAAPLVEPTPAPLQVAA